METSVVVADAFRVLALIFTAGTIGVALVVVLLYASLYRGMRDRAVLGDPKARWRGLLPRHVANVGVSYIVLLTWAAQDVYAHLHQQGTWRIPVALVASGLGLYAMWDVMGHSRHRLHALHRMPAQEGE